MRAVAGELPRLIVGQALGEREPAIDVLEFREVPMVLRRRDDRGVLGPALGCLADVDDRHPVGFLIELLQVLLELRVVDETVVVADLPAELLLRARDSGRRAVLRGSTGAHRVLSEVEGRMRHDFHDQKRDEGYAHPCPRRRLGVMR